MKVLSKEEIQFASGGLSYGSLIDASSAILGGYLGSSLAYIEPLMTLEATISSAGTFVTYTPNTLILISGIILGASVGYAVSKGFQQFYYSLEN
jgi:hypothetical protein